MSAAKLSRLERGLRGLQVIDVRNLCTIYGLSDVETRGLLSETRASREPGWWSSYSSLDSAAPMYFGLESAATEISSYQSTVVPGLLQTSEYATAVIANARPAGAWTGEAVMERVESRIRRKRALAEGKAIHFVIDEAVLCRSVGSPAVMVDQIRQIESIARSTVAQVRILPFIRGAHPGVDGSFTLLSFDKDHMVDAVVVETLVGVSLIDSPAQTFAYREVFNNLVDLALSAKESRERLRSRRLEWAKAG